MNLYHYRSVESARKEIECRTFRYADRNELNDPLEGYAQIYWKGDCPAWEGLFRNYICSVYYAVVGIQLNASEELLAERAVIPDIHCFDDVPLGQVWKELSDRFVQTALVQKLIVDLGNTETEMNAHRLRQILRLCHEDAIKICLDDMHKRKTLPGEQGGPVVSISEKADWEKMGGFGNLESPLIKMMKAAFEVYEETLESSFLKLEQEIEANEPNARKRRLWLKVRLGFPALYIAGLQELPYPRMFMMCFSTDGTNSAMWGNYAQNHCGVCLVYRDNEENGKQTLRVKTAESWSSSSGYSCGFRDDPVYPVRYTDEQVKRNFFESLGRLTFSQIESWMVSSKGERSRILELYDKDAWRVQYWKDQQEKYLTKLPAWSHEQEYRLLMNDSFHQHTEAERYVGYDPAILEGVIFGIKTSEADKMQIFRTLRKSMEEAGRDPKELEVWQAEYDDETRKISLRKRHFPIW